MLLPEQDQLISAELRKIGLALDTALTSDKRVPDTLYYPASSVELNAMLAEGGLPAFHSRMGWDGMLMDYASTLVTEILQQRLYSNRTPFAEEFRETALSNFPDVIRDTDNFLVRLYENASAPSYGDSKLPGYSLGLNASALCPKPTPGKPNLLLQPVIYTRDEQTQLVRMCYETYETCYLELIAACPGIEHEVLGERCWTGLKRHLGHILPRLRSPIVSKKQEWIAIERRRPPPSDIKIATIDNRYIPYIQINVTAVQDSSIPRLPLENIFIDASLPFEAGRDGLHEYLARQGYPDIDIL